jgi:hypothetical protein
MYRIRTVGGWWVWRSPAPGFPVLGQGVYVYEAE